VHVVWTNFKWLGSVQKSGLRPPGYEAQAFLRETRRLIHSCLPIELDCLANVLSKAR